MLSVHLYHNYTCITTTPVSRLHLYHDYTCITNTPVSRLHLYHEYTCITNTPESRLHLYHDYTCITTTPVSRLHLYHDHLHMQYSRNIWIEISTQQNVECTSKNKQSQVFHSSGNELNSRVVEGIRSCLRILHYTL